MSGLGPNKSKRRGMAVAAVLIVLSMMHLLVLGTLRTTADASEVETLRVETTRAFFAAEAGTWIAVRAALTGGAQPGEGSTVALGTAEVEFVESSVLGGVGRVVVEGRSGFGVRRVEFTIE